MFLEHHSASLPSMAPTFGQRIRKLREERKGWSAAQLAAAADVSANYMSRIERDEDAPSPRAITRIANALGVARDELGEPESSAARGSETATPKGAREAEKYPRRKALLEDPEFIDAPKPVRDRVLGWPDAGADWTTRQWYVLFEQSLQLHKEGKLDPRKDPDAKPARSRKR